MKSKWVDKRFDLTINDGTKVTINTWGSDLAGGALEGRVESPSSMTDIITNINLAINHQLGALASTDSAYGLSVSAVWSTGSNTLEFVVNSGVSNSDSSIVLSQSSEGDGSDLVFSTVSLKDSEGVSQTSFSDTGGETSPTQTVRYVSQIDISTRDSALLAMTVVDAALQSVAAARGSLGAVANRLESTIQNLMTTSENTSASLSRVMDADYAAESTALARAQVLQQASIAILAQANTTTQQVLRLLE